MIKSYVTKQHFRELRQIEADNPGFEFNQGPTDEMIDQMPDDVKCNVTDTYSYEQWAPEGELLVDMPIEMFISLPVFDDDEDDLDDEFDDDEDDDDDDDSVLDLDDNCPMLSNADQADEDGDQSDFGVFQRCLSGPNIPANPNCAD